MFGMDAINLASSEKPSKNLVLVMHLLSLCVKHFKNCKGLWLFFDIFQEDKDETYSQNDLELQ